jgi:4,5-DOPA dioxygenase extradiol
MSAPETLRALAAAPRSDTRMPVLFIGHGSPMNAIEDTEFSRSWCQVAESLPKPKAVLCISAHWETEGTRVTAMERPKMIYDFYGFPEALYGKHYAAPGAPQVARLVRESVRQTEVGLDFDWGLDHGAWSILCRMYPEADIPVIQLSLDRRQGTEHHYELGRELRGLREKGVLVVGSGNIVHNLRQAVWQDTAFDWALEFDARMKELILSGDHEAVIHYGRLGSAARLAVPTNEHFLPLLYVLALQDKDEEVSFFAGKVTLGSMSMRCVRVG